MKKWKEILIVMISTVVTIFFTGGIIGLYNVSDNEFRANAETLEYSEEIYFGTDNYQYDRYCTVNMYYEIIDEQYWDDSIGAPVHNSYIIVTGLNLSAEIAYTTVPCPPFANTYFYDIEFTIPNEIDGIPVKRIENVSVSTSFTGSAVEEYSLGSAQHTIIINIPESITEIDSFSAYDYCISVNVASKLKEIGSISNDYYTEYQNLTCAELFELFPSIGSKNGDFKCLDGSFTFNSSSGKYFRFDGTCAEWIAICPQNMKELSVTCSDGSCIADPPVPSDESYIFNKATKTATFIGNISDTIDILEIPSEIYGYKVTAIASDALVKYAELTSIVIPDTVKEISDYSVGYWKNSDNSYSRMSKVVIYCTEGSAAEKYAIKHNISYRIDSDPPVTTTTDRPTTTTTTTTTKTTTSEVVPGDLNGNGKMNMLDIVQMYQYLLGLDTLNSTGYAAADVNKDGKVNIFDLALMKKMLLEK